MPVEDLLLRVLLSIFWGGGVDSLSVHSMYVVAELTYVGAAARALVVLFSRLTDAHKD